MKVGGQAGHGVTFIESWGSGWAWCHILVTLELGRERQKYGESEVSLGHTEGYGQHVGYIMVRKNESGSTTVF